MYGNLLTDLCGKAATRTLCSTLRVAVYQQQKRRSWNEVLLRFNIELMNILGTYLPIDSTVVTGEQLIKRFDRGTKKLRRAPRCPYRHTKGRSTKYKKLLPPPPPRDVQPPPVVRNRANRNLQRGPPPSPPPTAGAGTTVVGIGFD